MITAKPRRGEILTYERDEHPQLVGTVYLVDGVEGNICKTFDLELRRVSSFIWSFHDGLNKKFSHTGCIARHQDVAQLDTARQGQDARRHDLATAVVHADWLGYAAALRNMTPRAPAVDKDFGALLRRLVPRHGESLPLLEAWHRGYQRQCDAAAAAVLAAHHEHVGDDSPY